MGSSRGNLIQVESYSIVNLFESLKFEWLLIKIFSKIRVFEHQIEARAWLFQALKQLENAKTPNYCGHYNSPFLVSL